MDSGMIDTFARDVATAQNRRASLKALGAAGLAALTAPPAMAKKKKNCTKKVTGKCNQQIDACQATVEDFCGIDPDCAEALFHCCDLFADCDAGAALTCILDAFK
jgi:hypothetical protein